MTDIDEDMSDQSLRTEVANLKERVAELESELTLERNRGTCTCMCVRYTLIQAIYALALLVYASSNDIVLLHLFYKCIFCSLYSCSRDP